MVFICEVDIPERSIPFDGPRVLFQRFGFFESDVSSAVSSLWMRFSGMDYDDQGSSVRITSSP